MKDRYLNLYVNMNKASLLRTCYEAITTLKHIVII